MMIKRILAAMAALLMLLAAGCSASGEQEAEIQDVSTTVDGSYSAGSSIAPEEGAAPSATPQAEEEEIQIPLPESDLSGLSRNLYEAVLRIDPEAGTIKGQLRLHYLNTSQDTLYELKLWLYPNAIQAEKEAAALAEATPAPSASPDTAEEKAYPLTVDALNLGGESSYYSLNEAGSILSVPLKEELLPGEMATLYFSYTLEIPQEAAFFGCTERSVMLGGAFPTALMYENGAWRTDEFSTLGDPFYSAVSDYNVIVARPEDYALAATGSVSEERTEGGLAITQLKAGQVRDFTLSLIREGSVATMPADGGVEIYALATTAEKAEFLAFNARIAINYFSGLIGQYPYERFCVVEGELDEGYGMEYSGIVVLSGDYMSGENQDFGRLMIAHEAAHQWFYCVVGTDQILEPWVDEAICELISYDELGMIYGKALPGDLYGQRFTDIEMFEYPVSMDAPTSAFDERTYFWTIFGGGSQMMGRIYEELGQVEFYGVLRGIYEEYQFGIVSGQAVIDAFVEAGGRAVERIFDEYMKD